MKTIAEKLEELNNDLKSLAPEVTRQMRMKWALDNDTSLVTVDRYFSGQAKMTVFAEKLYRDMCKLLGKPEKVSIDA